ncbi:MAG: MMPL family transporter [Planctomycetia bacterium]|nr:MMPL family transporter [Planctomycetia bacterium]
MSKKKKKKTHVSLPANNREPSFPEGNSVPASVFSKKTSSRWEQFKIKFQRYLWRSLIHTVSCKLFFSVLLCVLIPFIIIGAQKSWLKTENRVEDWVPASFSETKKLIHFMDIFGGDEILMISWEGSNLDDPKIAEFKKKLLQPVPIDGKDRVFFRTVITGTDMYDLLAAPPYELNDDEIIERLSGTMLSKDLEKTGIIALISADGMLYRQQAVNFVWKIADEIPQLGKDKIHVGGSTTDSVSIDKICRTWLVEMNLLTYLIGIAILYFCFWNMRVAMLVFMISFLNQQICLAMIWYLGVPFDSILMLSVNLMFVLSLSCSIHLVNYYRKAMEHLPGKLAVYKMLRNAALPVFGSIFTTVVGLLSLLSSQLIPIRKFGSISAYVLIISTAVIIIYISVNFLYWPVQCWRGGEKKNKKNQITNAEKFGIGVKKLFFPIVSKYPNRVLIVSLILFIIGFAGVLKIQTFVGIRKMLREQTRPIQDYYWLENQFGPLIPVEIMIETPFGDDELFLKRLNGISDLVNVLKKHFPDSSVISLLNFIPALPDDKTSSFRAITVKNVFKRKIFQNREQMKESGYFQEKNQSQYWRITVRTFTMKDVDYGAFSDEAEKIVREEMSKIAQKNDIFKVKEILISGGVPLVNRVQKQLIKDLQHSFLTAFILIGLVLAFVFRSFICGLLAVLPSVLPCLLVFGTVGFIGLKIELGTMLTGSAALGIAVDNTIHYITWFKIGISEGKIRKEAVAFAYEQCGMAMFQTTAVCALGLLAYTMSLFIPTIYFSIFMSLLLIVALLGSYIILPALLVKSWGLFFIPKNLRGENAFIS